MPHSQDTYGNWSRRPEGRIRAFDGMRLAWCVALCLLLVVPPAGAQTSHEPARGDGIDAPHPGDMIRLKVWREPDFSGEFMVDQNGVVVLPRLGPVAVTGESAQVLREMLADRFQRYLNHPAIEVTVLRRVQVLGAVRDPGLYPLDPTMTVSDAIAVAGGATPQGRPRHVELIRRGDAVPVQLSQETRIGDSPIQSGDQLYIPERSWISRNAVIVASGVSATASLLIALLLR